MPFISAKKDGVLAETEEVSAFTDEEFLKAAD